MITTLFALALLQGTTNIDRLCVELGSDDPEVRDRATTELPMLGRAALKAVQLLRESRDAEVKGRADQVFAKITAGLRKEALKLEVKLLDESYVAGQSVRFEARLKNVEEFPVEVVVAGFAETGWNYNGHIKQVEQLAVQRFNNEEYDEDQMMSTRRVTLKAGESVDVTTHVQVTFQAGNTTAATLESFGRGRITLKAVYAEVRAEQVEQAGTGRRINLRNIKAQQGQQVRHRREPASAAVVESWQAESVFELK